MLYQWVRSEQSSTHNQLPLPGKIDTATAWPPSVAADNSKSPNKSTSSSNASPVKGESKIPKPLTSSTPSKTRIQLISNFITLNEPTPSPQQQLESPEKRKLIEIKTKIGKCETTHEIMQIFRNFLNEHNMQSSESSSNSGIFTNSMLNGTDSTVYDRSMESTVFNILQHVPKTPSKQQTPPRKTPGKSRTTPNTPTGSSTRLMASRRNLSVDSVNTPTSSNGRSSSASPTKSTRRMVDKATVMDVEPLEAPQRLPEMKSIEVQTDPIEKETDGSAANKESSSPPAPAAPPPPPPMMRKFFNLVTCRSFTLSKLDCFSFSSHATPASTPNFVERSANSSR